MTIRVENLTKDKTYFWFRVNYSETISEEEEKEIENKAEKLRDKFEKKLDNPGDFFVAFDEDKFLGKIYRYRDLYIQNGIVRENRLWLLQTFKTGHEIKDKAVISMVFKSFVEHIKELPGWKEIKIMLDDKENFNQEDVLFPLGFKLESQKQYFRKELDDTDLKDYEESISKLTYKNLTEIGDKPFISLLQKTQASSFNEDAIEDVIDPVKGFNEMKDPERFDPELWVTGFFRNKPVGFVLPGVEKNSKPHTGFIQLIGVLPEYRNRGFGKILLKKGIFELIKNGAEIYLGSTDKKNLPMIKLFKEAGCKEKNLYSMWKIKR